MVKSFIQAGKRARNELYLPPLRYIVADDWIDKLGHDAFIAWLKFHTWVDRRDEKRDNDRIPYSLEDTRKKLGMGKKKFYEKVIRPLWEYGLIDIVEYEEAERKSQKPKNIIVYTSPANRHETETKPLVKLRDWNKDYGSASQFYGKQGGRPKKQTAPSEENGNDDETPSQEENGFQTETVGTVSKQKPSTVSKQKPSTVSKRKPNNISNNHTNAPNNHTNDSNNHHHHNEENQDEKVVVVSKEIEHVQNHVQYRFNRELTSEQANRLIKECIKHGKHVGDVIENTYFYFRAKKESPLDLMGALMYDAQVGWELPEKAEIPPALEFSGKPKGFRPYNWVDALLIESDG